VSNKLTVDKMIEFDELENKYNKYGVDIELTDK
jgi:hypothetical protein